MENACDLQIALPWMSPVWRMCVCVCVCVCVCHCVCVTVCVCVCVCVCSVVLLNTILSE